MNRDDIRTIGQSRMSSDDEKLNMWQGCANISKSIATSLEKAGRTEESIEYWMKAATYEQEILNFVEKNRLEEPR